MAWDSPLEAAIAFVSPGWALKRARARSVLAAYKAASPDRQRRQRRSTGSANTATRLGGKSLREQARYMDENQDLATGLLRTLVNNTVGHTGIGVEPQPLGADGRIDEDLARRISDEIWTPWTRRPEVTREHDWAGAIALAARTAYRDGEVLCRFIEGDRVNIRHSTDVPISIQLLEPDHLPIGYDRDEPRIRDGIEMSGWGAPRAYWLYREHPGDAIEFASPQTLQRIPAPSILHLKRVKRLHQRRGVSEFATVLERFDDLWQYEESEQVAAKVAASLSAVIIKGSPDLYQPPAVSTAINASDPTDATTREMRFRAGMVFDDLMTGEDVKMIGSNGRPNPGLLDFRHAMLRAIAAGPGVTFSSLSKHYDGSYSAMRQALVEGWIDYAVLSSWIISGLVRPIYERVISMAVLSGQLAVPSGVNPATIVSALFVPPAMPWIDPEKEVNAWRKQEEAGYISGPEVIRRRGGNPRRVRDDESNWRQSWRDLGETLTFDSASIDESKSTTDTTIDEEQQDQSPREAIRFGSGR